MINKITCITCSIFQKEIEELIKRGEIDCKLVVVDSKLHMSPPDLRCSLDKAIENELAAGNKVVLIYGQCHPFMDQQESLPGVARTAAMNCCQLILGKDEYHKLRKEGAFILLPEWAKRWSELFKEDLKFNPETAKGMMQEAHTKLIYLDTGLVPVPYEELDAYCEYCGLPYEIKPVTLDNLRDAVREAVSRISNIEQQSSPLPLASKSHPTASFVTIDIVQNILKLAANPKELGKYLTSEIRELTGARTVILLQNLGDIGGDTYKVVSVNPERRRSIASSEHVRHLAESAHEHGQAMITSGCDKGSVEIADTPESKLDICIAIPLKVGDIKVGTLLVLDIPDQIGIDMVAQLLDTLSMVAALILRSSFLYEDQEQIIEARTAQIKEKTEEIDRVFDLSLDMLCITDTDGYLRRVNPAWEKTLGYSIDELEGHKFLEFVHPDDRPTTRFVTKLSAGEKISDFTNRYRHKDGSYRWLEWRSTPPKNNLIYSVGRDITARKEAENALIASESRMRAILDHAPFGALVFELHTDNRLVLLGVNQSTSRILGIDCSKLIGMTIEEAFPALQYTHIPDAYRHVAATGEPFNDEQVEYNEQGISGCFEVYGYQLSPNIMVVLFTDVTARKRLEEEKRMFYRRTILAATNGTLDICDANDVKPYLLDSEMRMEVRSAVDVSAARQSAKDICSDFGLNEDQNGEFMIAVGEAITNSVKHALSGKIYAGTRGDEVWVAITDNGHGIESLILPSAVLRRGFSTKPSLGLGFSIMIEAADHIFLKTAEDGTTIVLFKRIQATSEISLNNIPDTWATIPSE